VPTGVPIPVVLTAAGRTAALGVLQQLGGAAWPGGAPLPVPPLQPQPGRLVLGEGAQVLRVAPIHLREKEQAGASAGGWHPGSRAQVGKLRQGAAGMLARPPSPTGVLGGESGGRGTPRGRGSDASGGPQPPAGVWEGAGQVRNGGIDGDCFAHAPSAGSWHRWYQSPALPRCPGHRAGLAEGGEGPLAMGARPAWPGDSPRADIGVVLALCGCLPLVSPKAGLGPPREAGSAAHT